MRRALFSAAAFDRLGWLAAGGAAILLIALLTGVVRAGPLDPTAPPSSTMKSLDVVEPRIPVASLPFTISQPGSYYLTGNLTMAGAGNGITIAADNVTLDLGGFSLEGANVGTKAVTLDAPHFAVTIRNGAVRNWTGAGIDVHLATGATLRGVHAVDNNIGIDAANTSLSSCTAESNTAAGIRAVSSTIGDCVSTGNQTGFDIQQTTLDGATAISNTSRGINAYQSTIRNCASEQNGTGVDATETLVERCALSLNSLGIAVRAGSNVRNNTIGSSKGDGIDVLGGSSMASVTDNVISQSGTVQLSAIGIYVGSNDNRIARNSVSGSKSNGINVSGSFNTIDDNNVFANGGFGIAVTGLKATVVRNTATANTAGNYSIAAGNNPAPVAAASSSTNPWANTQ
jgi:parallel beta-helix repeat protein